MCPVPEPASSLGCDQATRLSLLDAGAVENLLLIIGGNPLVRCSGRFGIWFSRWPRRRTRFIFRWRPTRRLTSATGMRIWRTLLRLWTDSVAYDGSHCVGQPMIAPLFDSKSTVELLAMLVGESKSWNGVGSVGRSATLAEADWLEAVHDGFVKGSCCRCATAVSQPVAPAVVWMPRRGWPRTIRSRWCFTPSRLA